MLLLYSVVTMVGLGVIFTLILFIADRKLRVEEDPRLERVEKALAGLNCAACGYPSCRVAAEAMIKDEAEVYVCTVGGEKVAKEVAKILGKEVKKQIMKNVAVVHCGINSKTRQIKSAYRGIKSCAAANLIMQGGMECKYGCLGLGDCKEVCPVGAIIMKDGAPVIDIDKCISCGVCVEACPRGIISLRPHAYGEKLLYVACNNPETGREVRAVCKVGCIACGICEKLSGGVFEVKDNLSRINRKKMGERLDKEGLDREKIIQKCPTKCILEK